MNLLQLVRLATAQLMVAVLLHRRIPVSMVSETGSLFPLLFSLAMTAPWFTNFPGSS